MSNFLITPYKEFGSIETFTIRYQSNGHWVNGFVAKPKLIEGKLPCIIFNRGGSFEFGAIDDVTLEKRMSLIASWGYVVIASQYSGNGGSEGKDECGGAEVDDVLCLKTYLENISGADTLRIGMVGGSRGGTMTYLCCAKVDWLKAAVIVAGMADGDRATQERPKMADVWVRAFGNTPEGRRERSAVHFAEKFCKTTPVLLMHGTADWRVSPLDSLDLATKLFIEKVPYRLVMFEGGDHSLSEHRRAYFDLMQEWLHRFVRDESPLPNLVPHGE